MNNQTLTTQVDIRQSIDRTTTSSSNSSSGLSNQERPSSPSTQSSTNRLFLTAGRLFSSRSRSRSKSPAPIDIPVARSRRSDSERTYILNRDAMARISVPRRSASPAPMSPTSSSAKEAHSTKRRLDSYHSRKSSDDYRRLNGTVSHKGRHSNDWLFGGFSLRDTVRGGVDRLRQRDERS